MYDLEGLSIAELEQLKELIGNNKEQTDNKDNNLTSDDIYSYLQSYTDEIEDVPKRF